MNVNYDLLIVIRCHDYFDFVVDAHSAAQYYTSERTHVVFSVDGGRQEFANKLIAAYGKDNVYVGQKKYGWGAGLYSLLLESYLYFKTKFEFNHLMSIDYDTLFIGDNVDKVILNRITSDNIGLIGCYRRQNSHWKAAYEREHSKFVKIFGEPGNQYIKGEGVQGGAMLLTSALLQAMQERNMFNQYHLNAKQYTGIADDHLLPIFVRMCGLEIAELGNFACCNWTAPNDPRGTEKAGVKIFHPTKLSPRTPSRSTEIEIRNYFRKLRKAPELR